jgi:uncharacterized membrane protein (UPF0127 family)
MVKAPPRGHRLTSDLGRVSLYREPAAWRAALLAVLLLASAAHAGDEPQELPVTGLNAGIHRILAQVATTPRQRSTGLMFRQAMAPNEGMLFIFDRPQQQCFWMKNTLLPLSAAFLAEDGSIVNIEEMQPESLETHCSTKPVRFVLEMHQGWFAKRGIAAGTRIEGWPFSAPAKPAVDAP